MKEKVGTTVHSLVVRALDFDQAIDNALDMAQGAATTTFRRCKPVGGMANPVAHLIRPGIWQVPIIVTDYRNRADR